MRYLGDLQVGFSPPHLISRVYYVVDALLKVKGQRWEGQAFLGGAGHLGKAP